jgi:hypothetical protein
MAAFDDSLTALESVAAAFSSDLNVASSDLVASRSERLRRRCVGAERASEPLLTLLPPAGAARHDLATLRAALGRCDVEFATTQSRPTDSLKVWAPYRLARLGDAVHRYRVSAGVLMRESGAK